MLQQTVPLSHECLADLGITRALLLSDIITSPKLQRATEGSQKEGFKQGDYGGMLLISALPLACSDTFPTQPRLTCLGTALPTVVGHSIS